MFLELPPLSRVFGVYAYEASENTHNTRHEGNVVGSAVALDAQFATTLTIRLNNGVRVVRGAVEEVVDVSADHGCERHEAPIDSEAIGTECIDHQSGEDTKENSICETSQTRHSPQKIRIIYPNGGNLGKGKDGRRDGSTPESRVMQLFNDEI